MLELAKIIYHDTDRFEPALNDEINSDNFRINIYNSRLVIIKVGTTSNFIMPDNLDTKENLDKITKY